ncbi:histidine phosphatase family protein [Chitinophaga vietnamensis]|uniref:histidine phosphatase family protein n=1 Tax=Chitinophaga vietnamensis TaxID=2593957 RepID=UPI001F2BEBF3|nr:histidine phosphatase family protein [Chitinophaga vietnamensis]
MITRIVIIRHGTTAWNKAGRLQGHSDIPLDEEGREQARKLARRLADEHWDMIWSSHLLRAKETAAIITKELELPVVLEDGRLGEAGGGEAEGTTEEERIRRWGPQWRQLNLGAESNAAVVARGAAFMSDLVANYPGKNILIVSHGSFIRQTIAYLVPEAPHQIALKNTAITELQYDGMQWSCELYNCVLHLEE